VAGGLAGKTFKNAVDGGTGQIDKAYGAFVNEQARPF
jgi:hypothetical protein